jgi:hypothetical protein
MMVITTSFVTVIKHLLLQEQINEETHFAKLRNKSVKYVAKYGRRIVGETELPV